jgi:predicted PurR-regulated permease PerM
MTTKTNNSPPWSLLTKAFVGAVIILTVVGLLSRFHDVIPILITALILAFLVVPLVRLLHQRTRLSWGLAANICFLLVLFIIIGLSIWAGIAVVAQLQALFQVIQTMLMDLPAELAEISMETYMIGPWPIDLSQLDLPTVAENLLASIQPIFGQASALIASLATIAIESIASIIFTFALAYFIIIDYPRIQSAVHNIELPKFQDDLHRLRVALAKVWNAFLRGQLLVVTSTGLLTWILMSALGLRFSLGLGVLGGLAKFVPILGPTTAGLVASLVALFQRTNWYGLTPLGYGILVILCVIILDQLIDYILVPRIMGATLNLHPVLILFGLLIGASLAGVLGLLLSAPMMASLILLGRYIFRKMFDLSPWDPPIDVLSEPRTPPARIVHFFDRIRRIKIKRGDD